MSDSEDKKPDKKPATRRFGEDNKTLIVSEEFRRKHIIKPTQGEKVKLNSNQKKIMLFIVGMVERIDFTKTPTVILGRFDPRQKADDEIDLSGYGAVEHGVSRSHCQLELKDGEIWVTDLGSSNGTFVMGNRLEPDQPYALKKGEDIILGRLPIQIMSGR